MFEYPFRRGACASLMRWSLFSAALFPAFGLKAQQAAEPATTTQLPPVIVEQSKVEPKKKKSVAKKAVAKPVAVTEKVENLPPAPEGMTLDPDVLRSMQGTTAGPVVGYQALTASTATKTSAPISKTPASISAVTKNQIEDQKVVHLDEVYQSVAGIQPVFNGGEYEEYMIRGFGASNKRYRNGMLIPPGTFDFSNVERVEVLKGPAALFAGRVEPGGIINVVTARPEDQFKNSVEVQAGSFDSYRTIFSTTGPANSQKTVLYRFDGAYTDRNSFQDRIFEEPLFLAPSVTLRPQKGTEITVAYEYDNRDFAGRTGLPAIDGKIADVPRSLNYSEPGPFNEDHIESHLIDVTLSHKLNEAMTVRAAAVATWNDYEWFDTPNAYAQFLLPGKIRRGLYFEDFERDSQSYYLDLVSKFRTGSVAHEVVTGVDHYRQESSNQGFWSLPALSDPHYTPPACHPSNQYFTVVDVFNPVVDNPTLDFDCIAALKRDQPNDFGKSEVSWTGLYVNDQITIAERLHILLGGRYDWGKAGAGSLSGQDKSLDMVTYETVSSEGFTPRAGALYDVLPWFSVYASYSESLSIDSSRGPDGAPLPPEEGVQYEGGVKLTPFGGGVLVTAAVYEITKSNVRAPNPADDGATSIAVGEVRSRGFELEAKGRVDDHWNVNGYYAYTDAVVTKDTALGGTEGNQVPNVPHHAGGVWLKYDVERGGRRGLSVGAGIWAFGQRRGDIYDTYVLDPYTRVDAFASYKLPTDYGLMTAQLNIYNIFDEVYYFAGPSYNTSPAHNLAGDPRTYRASLKFDF